MNKLRYLGIGALAAGVSLVALPASAAPSPEAIVTEIQSSVDSYVWPMVTAALVLFGIFFAIGLGIRAWKRWGGKG